MKNSLLTISLVGAMVFGAASANAIVFTDVHDATDIVAAGYASGFVQLNASGLNSYTGEFDLTTVGFDPEGMEIDSAYATFRFRDYLRDAGDDDEVTVDLGSVLGFVSGTDIEVAIISLGGAVELLADIQDDGRLNFAVRALEGSFLFKGGQLTAMVPDGGTTLALLGLGLIGLVAFRRRTA